MEALADMNASAMLLDAFARRDDGSDQSSSSSSSSSVVDKNEEEEDDDNYNVVGGIAQKRMGSVAGATSMGMLKRRAALLGGYTLSPRESKDLYLVDGKSNAKRSAVESLIEKLDAKIKERSEDNNNYGGWRGEIDNNDEGDDIIIVADGDDATVERENGDEPMMTKLLEKRKRGRPRKNSVSPEEEGSSLSSLSSSTLLLSNLVSAIENCQNEDEISRVTGKANTKVTGGSLMNKNDTVEAVLLSSSSSSTLLSNSNKITKSSSKLTLKGSSASMYMEPLIGVSAIVNIQRLQRRKSLSKPTIDGRQKKLDQGKSEEKRTYDNPGRGIANDALNLNRYYKTELLNAREEYTLGMKIRFMVKCQAVHEGLFLQLERNPSIAEWATACGFDEYDAEMYSEKYIDSDLDKEIRPSGSDDEDIDPSMFVGNGLVTESGVGRGKGRVKKPPPTMLRKFYDDSYEKFKEKDNDDDDTEGEVDIFLYRQRESPGEPINRGSPRIFREMMLTAKEAKQQMIQSNMRLVVSIARRYHGVGVNVQDLVQEGSLGLARAAEKFDPHKGFKFSTYASWWIQQAVFRSIAYHSRTIRLPVHVHNLLNKVRRARQLLQQELGRMPSNEEMAYEMDMSVEKYNKMIRNTRNAISLERPKYMNNPKDLGHESEASVGDMVDSSSVILDELTPEQSVDQGLLHSDIQYMLGKLGEDERGVLCLRYGINDGITRTVTLVASEMRQTKSWVRSQECRALRKLRRPWYERRLKEHRESLTASLGLPI